MWVFFSCWQLPSVCVRIRVTVKVCVSVPLCLCVRVTATSVFPDHLLLILSLIQEGGRAKCHRYWPKLGSKHNSATHGKFKVTTKFRTDSGCYATTGLKVKHLLSGQERTVWHLQYTDWPEQGCPEYVAGFVCEWDFLFITNISLYNYVNMPQKDGNFSYCLCEATVWDHSHMRMVNVKLKTREQLSIVSQYTLLTKC